MKIKTSISFRGSLAEDFLQKSMKPGAKNEKLNAFLVKMLAAKDPSLLKRYEADKVVIGRKCDLGKFPPDW